MLATRALSGAALALVTAFTCSGAFAADALVLGSSVENGSSSAEAQAAVANGYNVVVADDATWAGMTAAGFAHYGLVIVGDPNGIVPAVVSQNAGALADAVMARAGGRTQEGNRVLIGTDPIDHGGTKLIEDAIAFAGSKQGATNLYLTFSENDFDYDGNGVGDAQDKLLAKLTDDPSGSWQQNKSPPCGGSVSLIANAGQFASLRSADLQGWGCSDHETFTKYPAEWLPLAVATDTPTAPTCGTDVDTAAPVCGEAYILIVGGTASSPNLDLNPPTATKPVKTAHTLTATITLNNGNAGTGLLVKFVVTGINAGTVGTCAPTNCTSDGNGQVQYTYVGNRTGDDTVAASITLGASTQTSTAAVKWTCLNCNKAPVWQSPTPADGTVRTLKIGTAFSMAFKANDGNAGDIVHISGPSLPTGAKLAMTDGNPANATFTWTPAAGQSGTYALTFNACDNAAPSLCAKPRTITLIVPKRNSKLVADAIVATIHFDGISGATVSVPLTPVAHLYDAVSGATLVGRTVSFSLAGAPLCSAQTDSSGTAKCSVTVTEPQSILNLGYDAAFAGDSSYNASSAHGGLILIH